MNTFPGLHIHQSIIHDLQNTVAIKEMQEVVPEFRLLYCHKFCSFNVMLYYARLESTYIYIYIYANMEVFCKSEVYHCYYAI
jgi:hypothetical protein